MYIYVCWVALLYSRNRQNIVNQLYFNKLVYFILFYFILFFVFLPFLAPFLQHMEVPRLGVQSEL